MGYWTGLDWTGLGWGWFIMKLLPFVADYVIMNEATTLLQLVSLGFVIKGWIQQGKVN